MKKRGYESEAIGDRADYWFTSGVGCKGFTGLELMKDLSTNMPMMGNHLKDIIGREKVSDYRLSKDLGLDKGHLSNFLNGKAEYSLKKLTIIADYLGYDNIELIKRKPSKK